MARRSVIAGALTFFVVIVGCLILEGNSLAFHSLVGIVMLGAFIGGGVAVGDDLRIAGERREGERTPPALIADSPRPTWLTWLAVSGATSVVLLYLWLLCYLFDNPFDTALLRASLEVELVSLALALPVGGFVCLVARSSTQPRRENERRIAARDGRASDRSILFSADVPERAAWYCATSRAARRDGIWGLALAVLAWGPLVAIAVGVMWAALLGPLFPLGLLAWPVVVVAFAVRARRIWQRDPFILLGKDKR